MGLSQFDEFTPYVHSEVVTLPGATGNLSLIGAPGANLRIDAIYIRNWDVVAHVINFYIKHAGVGSVIGGVSVPGVPLATAQAPIEALALMGFTAQVGLVLGPTDSVEYQMVVAGTSGALVMTAVGGLV